MLPAQRRWLICTDDYIYVSLEEHKLVSPEESVNTCQEQ